MTVFATLTLSESRSSSGVYVFVNAASEVTPSAIVPVSPVFVVAYPSTAVSVTVYVTPTGMSLIVIDSPLPRETVATPSTKGTLPKIFCPSMSFCVVVSLAVSFTVNANLRLRAGEVGDVDVDVLSSTCLKPRTCPIIEKADSVANGFDGSVTGSTMTVFASVNSSVLSTTVFEIFRLPVFCVACAFEFVIVYVFVSPGLTSTSVAVTWFIAVVSSPSYTYVYTLAVSA